MRYLVLGLLSLLSLIAGILVYIFRFGPKLPPETNAIIDDVIKNDLPEQVVGETGYAESDGLRIWYESIAPENTPKGTVLLIMSTGGNALDWSPQFVRTFIDAGYQVVRYDHRGTGVSDRVASWSRQNPYTVADMAGDAAAVLDTLKVAKTHVVGMSMGGMIAQELAVSYPEKLESLTLMSTSGFIGDPNLPSIQSSYFLSTLVKGLPLLKYRILGGEANLIRERIAKFISMVGSEGLDVKETAEVTLYDLRKRRGVSISGMLQHQAAVTVSGSRYEKLKTLDVPTLIIHGTNDPLIPVEHGRKLVETIPNAESLWLDGVGHVFPYPNMEVVNGRILAHLEAAPS